MADTPHRAKKSKKNRKHGRNKRRGDRQKARTEKNKNKRLNHQRMRSNLPPVDDYTAAELRRLCIITR